MTLFEYISVAFSIVLSLSAAHLLGNLRSVLDPSRRDLVHALWVAHMLFLHLVAWWSGWALRDAEWNLGTFGLALSVPGLLYVNSSCLVPPDRSLSLREHFLAQRTLFFTTRGLLVVSGYALTHLLLELPFTASRLSGAFILAVCVVGVVSANRTVQVTIALLALLFQVFVIGYLRFEPGFWYRTG